MARYQVILAYDGTDFFGFQRQAEHRTVQGEVEAALRSLGWQGASLLAAGRTDTGVHARGQVIAFDLTWSHSPKDLLAALNAHLPQDVAAREVVAVGADFHPRFEAVARRYHYHIFCQPVRDPLRQRYAWRVWPPLEVTVLGRAAAFLPGKHDFLAFGRAVRLDGSTIRTVSEARWVTEGDGLRFEVEANAFLYHMVRRLVKAQVVIGQGVDPPDAIHQALVDPRRSSFQGLAPPNGLTLEAVRYR